MSVTRPPLEEECVVQKVKVKNEMIAPNSYIVTTNIAINYDCGEMINNLFLIRDFEFKSILLENALILNMKLFDTNSD